MKDEDVARNGQRDSNADEKKSEEEKEGGLSREILAGFPQSIQKRRNLNEQPNNSIFRILIICIIILVEVVEVVEAVEVVVVVVV